MMIDTATAVRFPAGANVCSSTAISRDSLPLFPLYNFYIFLIFVFFQFIKSFRTWFKGSTKLRLLVFLEFHAFSRQPTENNTFVVVDYRHTWNLEEVNALHISSRPLIRSGSFTVPWYWLLNLLFSFLIVNAKLNWEFQFGIFIIY